MNKITVMFFATFRDRAGTNRTEIEIPEGTTIAGLREILVEKYPGLETLAEHALASINREYAFDDQVIPVIQPSIIKSRFEKFQDLMGFSRGDHVIFRDVLLQHEPHGPDVIASMTPVPSGLKVSEPDFFFNA